MSIESLDLNLVLVLHTVLETGNVSRAAVKLHVTPSAVSNALARLREILGDPLVTRKGRGIVPTPRAIELAPGLARAVREIERVFDDTRFDAATCTRTFTLAIADAGQLVWGPRLATAFHDEMPRAQLRIIGIDALLSLGDLGSAEVDLHLGMPADGAGFHVDALFEEPTALVGRKGKRAALGALRHVRVDMAPGKGFRDHHATAFARARVPRTVVMTVPTFTVAAEIVATSDLVTMLPGSLFDAKGAALGLRRIALPFTPRPTPLALCWHERTHLDSAARAFRSLVRRVVMPT